MLIMSSLIASSLTRRSTSCKRYSFRSRWSTWKEPVEGENFKHSKLLLKKQKCFPHLMEAAALRPPPRWPVSAAVSLPTRTAKRTAAGASWPPATAAAAAAAAALRAALGTRSRATPPAPTPTGRSAPPAGAAPAGGRTWRTRP